MIKKVIVTNCWEAKDIVRDLRSKGENICWITISNSSNDSGRIFKGRGSNKDLLIMRFDDIILDPATPRQVRKIKNFILNHHVNSSKEFVLVINCIAGISRSAAIGKFCQQLGMDVQFNTQPFPNVALRKALGVTI